MPDPISMFFILFGALSFGWFLGRMLRTGMSNARPHANDYGIRDLLAAEPVPSLNPSKNPEKEQAVLGNAVSPASLSKSPFMIPDASVDGILRLAFTESGMPAGINPDECHVLIAGQTGCGKSTALKLIFAQALKFGEYRIGNDRERIICWVFAKAQDMRTLLMANRDILTVTFSEIKLNPLEPPAGMRTEEWANVFADMWIQAFRLYEGSKGFLSECLDSLYRRLASLGHYPSLLDLYYYIRALRFPAISRTARYQESVLNRLGSLIKGPLAGVLDCSKGHANNLISTHAIFEILYLTSEQQVFIVNYLLSHLFYYKLINDTGLRHFTGIDDANLIFDASFEKRPDLGLPIIHHLVTTVRKSRVNIFCCTQTPHQLGASIHSNAFAKIMFSLGNGKDFECMFQSMGIKNAEQRDYCCRLKQGEMIVKFSSRYTEPFPAIIPEVNL